MDNLGDCIEIAGVGKFDVEVVGGCLQKFSGLRLHDSVRNRNGLHIFNRQMRELGDKTGFVKDIDKWCWKRWGREFVDGLLDSCANASDSVRPESSRCTTLRVILEIRFAERLKMLRRAMRSIVVVEAYETEYKG